MYQLRQETERFVSHGTPYALHASNAKRVQCSASSLPHVKRHLDSCCLSHTASEKSKSKGGRWVSGKARRLWFIHLSAALANQRLVKELRQRRSISAEKPNKSFRRWRAASGRQLRRGEGPRAVGTVDGGDGDEEEQEEEQGEEEVEGEERGRRASGGWEAASGRSCEVLTRLAAGMATVVREETGERGSEANDAGEEQTERGGGRGEREGRTAARVTRRTADRSEDSEREEKAQGAVRRCREGRAGR